MKAPPSTIPTYHIKEINASALTNAASNELFVFQQKELPTIGKMFKPARTSHFTMHLHRSGELEVKINLIKYKVQQPCLFVVTPDCVREKVYESSDTDSTSLGFSRDFLGKAMLHKKHLDAFSFFSQQSDPLFLLTNTEADTLNELMLLLKKQNANEAHPYKNEMVHHAFALFMFDMARLAKKYRTDLDQKLTRKEDILFRFIRLLSKHFKEERSVQFYADSLFITPKHLTKTIKDITTKTCGDMIDDMVISEAKILLNDFSYSIGQVADQLHFSDQYFFSKFFKKHTGISPKGYKSLL